MTYLLWRGKRRQAQGEWTDNPKSEINDLPPVDWPEKSSSGWVDRRPQIRNQWLTACGGAREGKLRVRKAPDQNQWLTSCGRSREGKLRRPQIRNQWLTFCEGVREGKLEWVDRRLQIRNRWLTPCGGAREDKLRVSEQKAPGQESMTYTLWRACS